MWFWAGVFAEHDFRETARMSKTREARALGSARATGETFDSKLAFCSPDPSPRIPVQAV